MQNVVNQHDYINNLPTELLLGIFRQNLDERTFNTPKHYYGCVFRLALVCQRWKYVLDRDNYTWGFIPQGATPSAVRYMLDSSGSVPLRLANRFITSKDWSSPSSVFSELLIPHTHRWQDLSLLVTRDVYQQLREVLEEHSLPFLASLRLFVNGNLDFAIQTPAFLESNRPPRLRRLELRDLSVGFRPAWEGLEHLVVDSIAWCPSLDDVVSVLKASPSLRKLELQLGGENDGIERTLHIDELIPLPNLEYLKLHWERYTDLLLTLLAIQPEKVVYVDTIVGELVASIDRDPSSTIGLLPCVRRLCTRAGLIYIHLESDYSWRVTDADPNRRGGANIGSTFCLTTVAADTEGQTLPMLIRLLNRVVQTDVRFVLIGLDNGPLLPFSADWLRPFRDLQGEIFGVEAKLRCSYGGVLDRIMSSGWHRYIGRIKQLIVPVHTNHWGGMADAVRRMFKLDESDGKTPVGGIKALHIKTLFLTVPTAAALGPAWNGTTSNVMTLLGVDEVRLLDVQGNAVYVETR